MSHGEKHKITRTGWLRAAVLGANDAIVSVASMLLGVAASSASKSAVLLAGVAGLVAGALSMALGEFVSVSSQRDAEHADIEREKRELAADPQAELHELAMLYTRRGLSEDLALKVAEELSARNRLEAHVREELGIDPSALARPVQAAWISALSFATFGFVPVVALLVAPANLRIPTIAVISLACLATLGAFGGRLGGASPLRASLRVMLGGAAAMAATAAIGRLVGHAVN